MASEALAKMKGYMGVSENVVYPIVPNGFADHYPYEKWLAIIGKINPTFSDKAISPDLLWVSWGLYSEVAAFFVLVDLLGVVLCLSK